MDIMGDGAFTETLTSTDLAKGLRNTKRNPRNNKRLVECKGAVGLDGVLQVLDDLTDDVIDTSAITDSFPFPQLFVFTNVIIVCGMKKIYEYAAGSLTLVITASLGAALWSAVDFHNFVYMSNGQVAIQRLAESGVYEEITTQPAANSICNYNGQVLIGAIG